MIPYGRQSIAKSDIDAVLSVLQSDWLTQGPAVPRFENAICDLTSAKYAVAVNSATSALHIACLALGVGPGDWVWTSPNTFVATANCAYYCGAKVDFVDIDPLTLNMSVATLAAKLEKAKIEKRLPKVVIPVHFAGEPCDMEAISVLAHKYGFKIIEDASHAIGGSYKGSRIGSCLYSDVTVFSFHPVKIITTAEGGSATTNNSSIASKMRLLRSHGIVREKELSDSTNQGAWYYEQIDLGYNYRMTDIQAALGMSQLERIDDFIAERHRLAGWYDSALAALKVQFPARSKSSYSALHLYVIQVEARDQVFRQMRESGIGVNVHYIPVNQQPWHTKHLTCQEETPNAAAYYSRALSLPLYYGLSYQDQFKVYTSLKKALIE